MIRNCYYTPHETLPLDAIEKIQYLQHAPL
jgi:hypothetical protein